MTHDKLIAELKEAQIDSDRWAEICDIPKSDTIARAVSELSRLRAELSTQETLVATLREQKYAWDELLGENKFLLAELETANSLVKGLGESVKVVTLCGSSRFTHIMAVCAWFIERDEHAVTMGLHLLPNWYCNVDSHLAEHEGVAIEMDALHLQKIAMSDEVFVVNINDYIGESTAREVEFAKSKGIPIRWFTHDEIGKRVTDAIEAATKE